MKNFATGAVREHSSWRKTAGSSAWIIGTTVSFTSFFVLRSVLPASRCGHVGDITISAIEGPPLTESASPYGQFPVPGDPFNFIPCTDTFDLPPLHDSHPTKAWESLFDPNPDRWNWGPARSDGVSDDPYAGRGIYLCGYLDVPLDYLNDSDHRIVRLAVTKFQVSGLVRTDSSDGHGLPSADRKSERTIIIEPGGPGASGTLQVWDEAEAVSRRFSDGQFDVLGWDPRGVNISLPTATCFPHAEDIRHWSLLRGQYRETSNPKQLLEVADAMNNATFYACRSRLGDFGRFISTTSVARDLEEIRKALKEEELTAYLVSYGTGIGQIYANMFPNSVGRMVLDGPQYVKDQRLLGGWGQTSLDNVTDIWRDGFLGECIKSGPHTCALAQPTGRQDGSTTLEELEARMRTLFDSILVRPALGYTEARGPSLITYSRLVLAIYISLYDPTTWTATAQMLYELEAGNSTLAAASLELQWGRASSRSCSLREHASDEIKHLVICADAYDAPPPDEGLAWWDQLWANMTDQSWISGNSRFLDVFPCRHFKTYWASAAEVYRGNLNHSLKHPVLLIASTYDPATPLRNGRRLLEEMGQNARLIVHHGYGHTSRFSPSSCTNSLGKAFILNGTLPREQETHCYADARPYVPSNEVF